MRDLTGLRTERLTVVRADGRIADGHVAWLCQCDCGATKRIASNSLTRPDPVQSCGCLNRNSAIRPVNGGWNDGMSYLIEGGDRCYRTRHGWAKAAIKHYGNRCEVCGWAEARCDVHHRHLKSKGGPHTIANAVVLCPNHHRLRHELGGDA